MGWIYLYIWYIPNYFTVSMLFTLIFSSSKKKKEKRVCRHVSTCSTHAVKSTQTFDTICNVQPIRITELLFQLHYQDILDLVCSHCYGHYHTFTNNVVNTHCTFLMGKYYATGLPHLSSCHYKSAVSAKKKKAPMWILKPISAQVIKTMCLLSLNVNLILKTKKVQH